MIKYINNGMMIQRFYGICWSRDMHNQYAVAPVPFNILLGLAYRAGCWLRWGWRRNISPATAYQQGYQEGLSVRKRTTEGGAV